MKSLTFKFILIFISVLGFFVPCAVSSDPSGQLYFTNGDRIPAAMHRVANQSLSVDSELSDQPIQLVEGWVSEWKSTQPQPKHPLPAELARLSLDSGQILLGKLVELNTERAILDSLWGQRLQVDRNVLREFEMVRTGNGGRLRLSEWQSSGSGKKSDSRLRGWEAQGGYWYHAHPKGVSLNRSYPKEFHRFRVECKLRFLEEVGQYSLALTETDRKESGGFRGLRISHNKAGIQIYSPGFVPQHGRVQMPKSEQASQTHHLVIEFDPEQRKLLFFMNGEALDYTAFLIQQQEGPLLRRPNLKFQLGGGQPLLVQQLGLFSASSPMLWKSPDSAQGILHLVNGDQLEAEVTSFDGNGFQVKRGDQSFPFPKEGFLAYRFPSSDSSTAQSSFTVSLQLDHPMLYAENIDFEKENMLKLDLPGVRPQIQLDASLLRSITWPEAKKDASKEGEFLLTGPSQIRISGEIDELTEQHLRMRPTWTEQDLQLDASSSYTMTSKRKKGGPILTKGFVFKDGDMLAGELHSLQDESLQIHGPGFGSARISQNAIRLIYQSKAASSPWLVDPFQLALPIHGKRSGSSPRISVLEDGAFRIDRLHKFAWPIPQQADAYRVRMKIKPKSELMMNVQLGFKSERGKRSGCRVSISRGTLRVQTAERKAITRKVSLPKQRDLTLDLLIDKAKRRVRVVLNKETLLDRSGLKMEFLEKDEFLKLSGIPSGTEFKELSLIPVGYSKRTVPVEFWSREGLLHYGEFVGDDEGNPIIRNQKSERRIDWNQQDYSLIRAVDHLAPEPQVGSRPVQLQLQDNLTQLRGERVRISEGSLSLDHPAFEKELKIPLEEVKRLQTGPK